MNFGGYERREGNESIKKALINLSAVSLEFILELTRLQDRTTNLLDHDRSGR